MKVLALIPARMHSTRLPGKPLSLIGSKPMVQHVYERVVASGLCNQVVVATDHAEIVQAVESFGGEVCLTSHTHPSGTDRCAEAARMLNFSGDVVLNVQGDEPFIEAGPLRELIKLFNRTEVEVATLVTPLQAELSAEPSVVKCVRSASGKALYFSRAAIPYPRETNSAPHFWRHLGVYAYRPQVLQKLVALAPSFLENTEQLEQLRWLENDIVIHTAVTETVGLAVDTPADLELARQHFAALNNRAKP